MSLRRTALVTGATGGLGRAIAVQLAGDGLDVVVAGRSPQGIADLAEELAAPQTGRRVRAEACDLSNESDIRDLVARLAGDMPDVLVNNAAIQGPIGRFLDAPWDAWTRTLTVDLLAPALLVQLTLPTMIRLADLRTKIYADGADLETMLAMYRLPHVKGFTTNPTLMRRAGVTDYRTFARQVLARIPDRPISFEVFADDLPGMERQAREIATWGGHVYVKIPVTNTAGVPTYDLVHRLSHDGLRINVTALMTIPQLQAVVDALRGGAPANASLFAGRVADTGRDPVPHMPSARHPARADRRGRGLQGRLRFRAGLRSAAPGHRTDRSNRARA